MEWAGGNIFRAPVPSKPASGPFPDRPMPDRRGMIIKNVSEGELDLRLETRTLHLEQGEERPVTAPEVQDATLRQALQVRSIAIVRPMSDEEAAGLEAELSE